MPFCWVAIDLSTACLSVCEYGDIESAHVRINEWHHIISEYISRVRTSAVHVVVGCRILALTLSIVSYSDDRVVCTDCRARLHVGRVSSHSHYHTDTLIACRSGRSRGGSGGVGGCFRSRGGQL